MPDVHVYDSYKSFRSSDFASRILGILKCLSASASTRHLSENIEKTTLILERRSA